MARFERFGDREAVIKDSRKLKGTEICINKDFCAASQELRKSQLTLLKKAREEGKIAFFKHTKLVIKERTRHVSSSGGGDVSLGQRSTVGGVAAVGTGAGVDGALMLVVLPLVLLVLEALLVLV